MRTQDCPSCKAEDCVERLDFDSEYARCTLCNTRFDVDNDYDDQGDGRMVDCSTLGGEVTDEEVLRREIKRLAGSLKFSAVLISKYADNDLPNKKLKDLISQAHRTTRVLLEYEGEKIS